jgi:tetratricopeptide (TPR) repeat protein/S1-C subfamily serine protease
MKTTVLTALLLATNLLPAIAIAPEIVNPPQSHRLADAANDNNSSLTPQQIRTQSTKITVRISSENNGGSGVLIGKKATKNASGAMTYLVLTNRHVTGNSTKFQIKTADGKQHTAQLTPNTQISPKYDAALLQFTSTQKYQLADLNYDAGKNAAIATTREIYSAGFPFDSAQLRFTSGAVTQLSDVPLDDGTQIGYITNQGEKNIRQGMSGGPVLTMSSGKAVVIGINTIGAAPLIPSYTYFDGSKPNPKRSAEYAKANWGVPIYNLLSQLNPQILYQYDNLPKVQRQVTPTGYMAQLNRQTRQQTVRIEYNDGNGSGVIVAKQGSTYYVLTAKHVVTFPPKENDPKNDPNSEIRKDLKTITHDQESYTIQPTDITLAEGLDLAVVKFTSNVNYPVAPLGNYSPRKDATVFAAGFPARERVNSLLWQWQLNPGKNIANQEFSKFQTQDKFSFESNGYDLIYSSISYGGMSGGPVFDTEGRVVGIHAATEGDTDRKEWNEGLSFGNSLGISIRSFIGLATKLKVSPQLLKTSKNTARDLNAGELATVVAVRDSISQPPADGDAKQWLQYGNQLHRIGKYAEAVKAFDIAIAKGGASTWAGYYGKARAFGSDKKYPQALASISTAISTVPAESRRSYYFMWQRQSGYYLELRKYNEAIKAIDIAIALEPTDPLLLSAKARIFNNAGKYQQAIAIYDKLIKERPENYMFISRGHNKLDAGDKAAALLDFNKAISLDPNSARGYLNRGILNYRNGNSNSKTILDIDKAISLDDRSEVAYFLRANSKLQLGDNKGALLDAETGISLEPKSHLGYIARGNAKSQLGDRQGALLDFDKAIAVEPNQTYPFTNRGSFRAKLGDKQGSLSDFDRAASINPNESAIYSSRGAIKLNFGDKKGALVDYNRAILLDSKSFLGYVGRGFVREKLGDNPGALVDYDKSILIDPSFPLSLQYRGDIKLKLGDTKGALLDHEKLISLNIPKETGGYIGRGDVKLKLGDKQGALADYEKAIAIDPKQARGYIVRAKVKTQLGNKQGALLDYNTAISLNPTDYRNYYVRGTLKLELGDKKGAVADYDKAIAVAPKEPLAYIGRAVFKITSGDKAGGILDLSNAILLDPNNPSLYSLRGGLKFESGDKQGALSDYNKLIIIDPKSDINYNARSEIKLALGDKTGAIVDCDRAISLNPKNVNAYFTRGSIKSGLGDRQGAINDYSQVIKINPQNYSAYINRGVVKFELGNLAAAIADTDRAIAINPKLSLAYSNRGLFSILNGGERDVLVDLERAIQLDPKQSESYASRGFIREMSGDKQNAISDYRKAVQLSPQIVSDWKKQSGLIQKSNPKTYQKYQQMIQKLEIGSRIN